MYKVTDVHCLTLCCSCIFSLCYAAYAERIDEQFARHEALEALLKKKPGLKRKSREDIEQQMRSAKPVQTHELMVFIGLLIGCAVMPNREKFSHHWRTTEKGAIRISSLTHSDVGIIIISNILPRGTEAQHIGIGSNPALVKKSSCM